MRYGMTCALLALYTVVNGAQAGVPRSVVTPETLDFANTGEFPKNPGLWEGDYRRQLLGVMHIHGPMWPSGGWVTGASSDPTVHIRVAFTKVLPVGSIIGGNGWQVSTLRPDAPYPGDVSDEAHWQKVPEVEGQTGLRVLPLPEVANTRAVRFSRTRTLRFREERAERMHGAMICEGRFHSFSPEATASASSGEDSVQNLTTTIWPGWHESRWLASRSDPITPENPEWVILSWDSPRELRSIGLLNAFAKRVEFDIYTGAAAVHPLKAAEGSWKHIGGLNPPVWWRPPYEDCYFDLRETHATTAVRMRITQPLTNESQDTQSYRERYPMHPAYLDGFMVMTELGAAPIPPRPARQN